MARARANTNLVQETVAAGIVPANRPIDHARRIGAALAMGIALGTVGGVLFLDVNVQGSAFFITMGISLILLVVCLIPWLIHPKNTNDPIPVVARTLGTQEPAGMRYVHRGTNRAGLLVPVVARPLDGSPNFRSIVILKDVNSKNPQDPPVGTLMPLDQTTPGMGELVSSPRVTEEQAALMERLRKHPRELSNAASPLPLRRGPMERTPWWAAAQWWGSIAVGLVCAMLLVQLTAGN